MSRLPAIRWGTPARSGCNRSSKIEIEMNASLIAAALRPRESRAAPSGELHIQSTGCGGLSSSADGRFLARSVFRNSTGNVVGRNELQIQLSSLLCEPSAGGIWFHTRPFFIDVFSSEFHHSVDSCGQVVCHRAERLGRDELGCNLRKFAHRALWLGMRLHAASRRAVAARFTTLRVPLVRTLPPLIRLSGHRPSLAKLAVRQTCFSVFQRLMSNTDLGDDRMHGLYLQASDSRQVDSCHVPELLLN